MNLTVQLSGIWIELPVLADGDTGDWAKQTVAENLEIRSVKASPIERTLYEQTWAAILDDLRERADQGDSLLMTAYGLVPDVEFLPRTIVELHVAAGGSMTQDAFAEALVLPEELRFGPPEITTLDSPAGQAVRVKQLPVVDKEGKQEVHTVVGMVWQGPRENTFIVMSSYFASPMDAETCLPEVDAIAATVTFENAA